MSLKPFFERLFWLFGKIHSDNDELTAAIESEFLSPSRHGDHPDFNVTVMKFGTSSMTIQTIVECSSEVRFSSRHTMVCIGRNDRRMQWAKHVRTDMKRIAGTGIDT